MIEQEAQGLNLADFPPEARRLILEVLPQEPGPIDEGEDSSGASEQERQPRATKAVACQGGAWVNADCDQKTASGDEVVAYRNRDGELMLPSASGVEPGPFVGRSSLTHSLTHSLNGYSQCQT